MLENGLGPELIDHAGTLKRAVHAGSNARKNKPAAFFGGFSTHDPQGFRTGDVDVVGLLQAEHHELRPVRKDGFQALLKFVGRSKEQFTLKVKRRDIAGRWFLAFDQMAIGIFDEVDQIEPFRPPERLKDGNADTNEQGVSQVVHQ